MRETVSRWISSSILVLALAFILSTTFAWGSSYTEGVLQNAELVSLSKAFFVFAAALFAFKYPLSIQKLYAVLLIAVFCRSALYFAPLTNVVTIGAFSIVTGAVMGLSILSVVASFGLLPHKRIRGSLLVGFACAALVRPFFHLITPIEDELIQEVCFYIFFLLMTVFVFLHPKSSLSYPAVKPLMEKREDDETGTSKIKLYSALVASQHKTMLIAFVGMVLLVFSFGAFETYSLSQGSAFFSSDVVMYVIFGAVAASYVAHVFFHVENYLKNIHHIIWILSILLFLVALIFLEYSSTLFIVLGAGFILLHIPLFVGIIEDSVERDISPLFQFGLYYSILCLASAIGFAFSILQLLLLGSEDYFISKLVAVCIALIAIIVTIAYTLKMQRKENDSDKYHDEKESALTAKSFEQVYRTYGLTAREREVIDIYSQGRDVSYISSKLLLSQSTIRAYIRQAYVKLGVHNKQELLDLLEEKG